MPPSDPHLWDTALFVAMNVVQLGFYFYVTGRNYVRHRRTVSKGDLA